MNILQLPADILYSVCYLTCVSHGANGVKRLNHGDIGRFQSVCQEFRNIATSLPQLWTQISDAMALVYIELLLSRSGGVGLDIRLRYVSVRPCICPTWTKLKEHMHRWNTLEVELEVVGDAEEGEGDCESHECPRLLQDLDLPSLISLGVDIPNSSMELGWNTPKLKALTIRSPTDLHIATLSCTLERLEVISVDYARNFTSRNTLLDFLEQPAVASLESLTLDFSKYGGFYEYRSWGPVSQRANVFLPRLKVLTADFAFSQNDSIEFDFLSQLDMPNLVQLHLRVNYTNASYNDYPWEWMAHFPTMVPSLQTFCVAFTRSTTDQDERASLYRKVLGSLPDLSAQENGKEVVAKIMTIRRRGIEVKIVFEQDEYEDEDHIRPEEGDADGQSQASDPPSSAADEEDYTSPPIVHEVQSQELGIGIAL